MKKSLLLFFVFASALTFAQKKDISITMTKPGASFPLQTNQGFDLEYTITNLGPALTANDTIVVLPILGNNVVQVLLGFYNRPLNTNDTIMFKGRFGINFGDSVPTGSTLFCLYAALTNKGNQDSVSANNISCASAALPVNEIKEMSKNITVYPNPASEFLNISGYNNLALNMEIYDVTGKLAMKEAINGIKTRVDISSLPNGIYIYQLNTLDGENVKSSRFTISK